MNYAFLFHGLSTDCAPAGCVHSPLDVALQRYLKEDEKAYANKIEPLDEFEEFSLLLNHYCILWATFHRVTEGTREGMHFSNLSEMFAWPCFQNFVLKKDIVSAIHMF